MDPFQRWGQMPDAEIDLASAALAIAADAYPDLDPEPHLARLDELAAAAALAAGDGAAAGERVAALDRQLFRVEGFSGNADAYYDPRNSYLNEVLERRIGIPITLSVLYMEVGRRLGLSLEPVGFPGHFLVAWTHGPARTFIDAFHGGQRMERATLTAQLARLTGEEIAREGIDAALAPVPRREVVARMLRNLKGIYVNAGDWGRALQATDRLVSLCPETAPEVHDRGRLYEKLDAHAAAVEDYERYLQLAPEAADAGAVRARIAALRARGTRLN